MNTRRMSNEAGGQKDKTDLGRCRSREWTRACSFKWILSVGDAYNSVPFPSRAVFRVPSRRF